MFMLQTFGGLTLLYATTRAPVGTPRRKPLAVLALVAAAAERGVERDWVASMLWPSWMRHARGAPSRRRSTRCVASSAPTCSAMLRVSSSSRRSWSRTPRTSRRSRGREVRDATWSERCHSTRDRIWTGSTSSGAPSSSTGQKLRALRTRARYLGALRELARLAAAAGDSAKAVLWLERAANDNPLDSDIVAALARLYADLGRHGQGHALLNAHFAALRAELGVGPPARLMSLEQELQEAPSEIGATSVTPPPTRGEARSQRGSGSPDRSEPAATRERTLRTRITRVLAPSGLRSRRTAIIASIAGLATAAAGAVNLIRSSVNPSDTLPRAFAKELSLPSRVDAGGRVLVHVISMPTQDPLATYVSDVLMARLAERAALVPREEVLALEHRLYGESSRPRDQPGSTDRLLKLSGASIAVEAGIINVGQGDSLGMALTLSRRTKVPPCPEAWVRLGPEAADPGGEYPGFESWSSFRLRAPTSAPTNADDFLVRAATRALESMNSCDIEAHRGPMTSPWCWAAPIVSVSYRERFAPESRLDRTSR